jgi:hypothetical protein
VRTLTDTRANARKQATFCGRPCTSQFKGVHWDARRDCWVAKIKKNRASRWLGSFHDEVAAAQAYDGAARELFGEHARLNFPSTGECGFDGVAGPWSPPTSLKIAREKANEEQKKTSESGEGDQSYKKAA